MPFIPDDPKKITGFVPDSPGGFIPDEPTEAPVQTQVMPEFEGGRGGEFRGHGAGGSFAPETLVEKLPVTKLAVVPVVVVPVSEVNVPVVNCAVTPLVVVPVKETKVPVVP